MIHIALIEKYFSNKLSDKERVQFNSLYENNIEFKAEVDFLKNVKSVSEKEDSAQFKKQLASYESKFQKKQTSPFAKWIKPIYAVAAIFLIGLSIHFFMNTPVNENELFVTYFLPSKNVSAPITRSQNTENLENEAFISYNEAKYSQALTLFKKAYQESKNSELLFYEGNALLALNKPDEAILKFKEHIAFNDGLANRSHWYLALAYLKTQNIESAKLELELFINSGETFKIEDAKSLLKKLD